MSSGQTYDVRHPEMALLTRNDILVGIDQADDGVPAEFKICSLLHATAIEPLSHPDAQCRALRVANYVVPSHLTTFFADSAAPGFSMRRRVG
jgi:hypothetical protein